jgi:hypothetical protein
MNKLKQYPPTRQMNGVNGELAGSWYPQSRPQHHYRLKGHATNVIQELNGTYWTFRDTLIHFENGGFFYEGERVDVVRGERISFTIGEQTFSMTLFGDDISWAVSDGGTVTWTNMNGRRFQCDSAPTFVKQYKMLGKKANGTPLVVDCAPQRSISSFSGRAGIRPSNADLKTKYYADTSQYLKSRGNTYQAKSVIHKVPEVKYIEKADIIWPNVPQQVSGYDFPLNSAWFQGCAVEKNCKLAVYKPSNYKFSVQGAVAASTRLERLKLGLNETTQKKFIKKCCPAAR